MDISFQFAYGWLGKYHPGQFLRRWGTADHWPKWAQIVAGRHGYLARGWYPWPKTAHYCGLL